MYCLNRINLRPFLDPSAHFVLSKLDCLGALFGPSAHFLLSKPRCFGACFQRAENQADDSPVPARAGVPAYYLILTMVPTLVGPDRRPNLRCPSRASMVYISHSSFLGTGVSQWKKEGSLYCSVVTPHQSFGDIHKRRYRKVKSGAGQQHLAALTTS